MTAAIYAPFAICALLALGAPLGRRLPPGPGGWLLVAGAGIGAFGTMWTLALLAASLVDDIPALDGEGEFGLPTGDGLSALALLLLGFSTVRLAGELAAQRRLRTDFEVIRRQPGPDLVVLPDPAARAFAVPGRPGRIVVTDTMLRALSVAERRALLAHERAHLSARHPVALALLRLAVAANPMVVPVARTAEFLIERHADEAAARAVGDRRLVADALAAAALATVGAPASTGVSFHGVGVLDRLAALRDAPRSVHRATLVPVAALIALGLFAGLRSTVDFAELLERLLRH